MKLAIVRGMKFWVDEESRIFYFVRTKKYGAELKNVRPYLGKRGYWAFSRNGNTIYAHTVIAAAWHPNPQAKPTVNHKNGVKSDNRIDNLEWATQSEQVKHFVNVLDKGVRPGGGLVPNKRAGIRYSGDGVIRAHVNYNYRQYYVGTFATEEAAARAREEAKQALASLPEQQRKFWTFSIPEWKRRVRALELREVKYSEKQIAEVRRLVASGVSRARAGELAGVNKSTVQSIIEGRGRYGERGLEESK